MIPSPIYGCHVQAATDLKVCIRYSFANLRSIMQMMGPVFRNAWFAAPRWAPD